MAAFWLAIDGAADAADAEETARAEEAASAAVTGQMVVKAVIVSVTTPTSVADLYDVSIKSSPPHANFNIRCWAVGDGSGTAGDSAERGDLDGQGGQWASLDSSISSGDTGSVEGTHVVEVLRSTVVELGRGSGGKECHGQGGELHGERLADRIDRLVGGLSEAIRRSSNQCSVWLVWKERKSIPRD